MDYPKIVLRPGKEESLRRFHPWIFSGAIDPKRSPQGLQEGDTVSVHATGGDFLAVGQLQIGSIAVRVLSFEPETIDEAFYRRRLAEALRLRRALNLVRPDQQIYRLVHGEGDHLPGLVIDIYGDTAVMQAHAVGVHLHRQMIASALKQVYTEAEKSAAPEAASFRLKNIYYKSESTLPYKAEVDKRNEYLSGGAQPASEAQTAQARENGLVFLPNWEEGQKTGFFIDQRDNRALVGRFAKDRRVLNMFCYTGGFSVYALAGGAAQVDSVDASARAMALTDAHVQANFGGTPVAARHRSFTQDAFEFLDRMEKDAYDLIVLDPPAFAKHRDVLHQALQGYRKLNAKAFEKIAPGGWLFTFSCSQAVDKDHFRQAVFSAAAASGRRVRIVQMLSQGADHPINIYHPEGEYLKGLLLYVE
ncbi:MAG: class I SAM-dependent rRNA methyltransferase [Bacteroidales bacterium]|nr:class I SAM-dependent rRNA methyltransferase [Bacteroidales bacterium]